MCEKSYCLHCKQLVFPKQMKEFQGEPGHGGMIEWEECPLCEEALDPTEPCSECSNPKKEGGDTWCEECAVLGIAEIREFYDAFQERWTEKFCKQIMRDFTEDNCN